MSTELDKTFDPAAIEAKWYQHWESNGLFRPERPDAEPFTIVNPPPNVTGSLHIGHALDNTLQDVVIRYERLRGKDALWVVGTDHAGIATQMVVERQLEAKQDKRTNYSREDFIAKVWEWKEESGGTITRQLRRLGCSMDWSREQFTMDEHFTRAVLKVFVDLYNKGLIYRDKRLVNWDPKLKTAISDLEVETQTISGGFWHFKYPLAPDENGNPVTTAEGKDYLVVATTRPETMLADMAVAVHPTDARYASVVGKEIVQPITGRRFKVVADEHADPELGSGCVKITPGHDFNDFEVGKRAGIAPGEMLNMLDAEANVCQTADGLVPEEFLGLHRFKRDGVDGARELVVRRMKELGFLIPHVTKDKDGNAVEHDAEPRQIATPFGDRGGVVIEPWLTDQWYVNAAELAKKPIEAVRSGEVEIVPKTWEKTFFNWMENIQPWCVSRQLWWGHRIPAWYGPRVTDENISYDLMSLTSEERFIALDHDAAIELAKRHYGPEYEVVEISDPIEVFNISMRGEWPANRIGIWRDPDVLDTWFSSALWPFATLGWPEDETTSVRPELVEGPSSTSGAALERKGGASTGSARTDVGETRTGLLQKHYPNSLLISGFDILFFWDARMLMAGYFNMGERPWDKLYLHGLVRAADGQKMSKSKGNVVDPLGLIDRFGADALRFFMCAMESQGRDIKMDEKRIEGYRNFATKLWNATRFCQSNGIGASDTIAAPEARLAANQWIIGEVQQTVQALDAAMADLRFDAAANTIYHFVWDRFCDWYLELIKPVFNPPQNGEGDHAQHGGGAPSTDQNSGGSDDPNVPLHPQPAAGGPPPRSGEEWSAAAETRAVAGWALDQILVMLHPFMPFITEELWHAQGERPYELILAHWPEPRASVSKDATDAIDWVIELVTKVRSARNELNVPFREKLTMRFDFSNEQLVERLNSHRHEISRLAGVDFISDIAVGFGHIAIGEVTDDLGTFMAAQSSMQVTIGDDTLIFPLEGIIDIAAEKARLEKALATSQKEAKSLEGRLSNPAFAEKAKPEAVDKARTDLAYHQGEVERLTAALARLG